MFYVVICKLCCIVLCFIIMYFVLCCVGNKLYVILSYLTWIITQQMTPENHKCEMVKQSQHFVDEDKSTASRNITKTKRIDLDWSHD